MIILQKKRVLNDKLFKQNLLLFHQLDLKDWLMKSQLLVFIFENLQCRGITGQRETNGVVVRKEGNRKLYTHLFNFTAQKGYWSK